MSRKVYYYSSLRSQTGFNGIDDAYSSRDLKNRTVQEIVILKK